MSLLRSFFRGRTDVRRNLRMFLLQPSRGAIPFVFLFSRSANPHTSVPVPSHHDPGTRPDSKGTLLKLSFYFL
jgi:hypothetical protein